jgi:SSS family transporter
MLQWEALPPLPDPLGVAGPFAGVSGDALLVAGGANFPEPVWESGKVWRDTVYALEREAGGTGLAWSVAGRLPEPLAYGMSVTHGGSLICMGGEDGKRVSDAVFAVTWDPAARALRAEALPPLPQPCAFGQAALVGDTVYVAGGQRGGGIESAMGNFWRLDLSKRGTGTFAWQALPAWPGPERVLAVVAAQNTGKDKCVYVFSGRRRVNGAFEFLTDAYEFNPRTYQEGRTGTSWRSLPDVPACVMAGTAAAVGQAHVFVLGGADGSLFERADEVKDAHPGFPKRAYAYHTITKTWADAGPSPVNQVTTVAVPWGGRVVIPSGEIRPRVRTPAVWSVAPRVRNVRFGFLNYATLALYLAAMVGIGAWFARKNKSTDDYFRGGQKIPWWAAGCSIFATMLSSITFMALPAVAFKSDWTTWVMHWMIPAVTALVIWKVLPFFRQIDATSAYEYLEKRFGYTSRALGSLLFGLFQVGRMGVVLYLPALALQAVTGLAPIPCILIMGVSSILYSALGGIEAVIWTDTVQTFVLLGGALLSVLLIVFSIDGGASAFFATALEHQKFHLFDWDFSATSYMAPTLWVIVSGAIFQHLSSYTADQAVIQRYMTTDTEKNAARAILTNGLLSVPAGLLFFLVGTALFVYYRGHPQELDPNFKADAIFPLFIATRMPPVAAGLVVAGVFAAAQSTLSTSMNSLATTLITDFARPFRLCRTDRAYLALARGLTVLLGGVGTATAVLFVVTDVFDIYSTYITILGLFMGVLCGMFMLGMFTRRATSAGCLAGAVLTAGFTLWVAFKSGWGVHGYLYPALSVLGCMGTGYLLSLLLVGKRKDLAGLTVFTVVKKG